MKSWEKSSRGKVLRGLPDLRSQFAEICSLVDLLSIRGVRNAEQCLLHTDGYNTLLKRHSRPTWNDVWHWFSKIFFSSFLLTIRKLSNCVLYDPRGMIIRFAVHILHVVFINVKIYDNILS